MAGRTVRVRGLPAELPPDRVIDKLTIHFMRSRNGGGDIAEVRVLPGPPPCALITFEAPEVAQRILKLKDHVLVIGGRWYPLEVTWHAAELSPDEIFIRVSMIIDYGKLPTGKTLLRDLHKGYSNVQFNFDSRNTHCIVRGPFTELQAFSRDLLGSLNLRNQGTGEIFLPGSSHRPKEMGMHNRQQVPNSTKSAEETAKLPNWDQVCEMTPKVPSPRGPVDGEAIEQLEDFSLVMDLDIYLYMQKFRAAAYQGVLRQHHVDVVDVSSGDIAILYLQPSAGLPGDIEALRQARLALQQLYQQLEVSLRKEKIAKGELGMDSQVLALTDELQKLYPQLLCHEDVKQLYLIGNAVDVSQAKQYFQDSITRRVAARKADMLSSNQPSDPATSGTTEAVQHLPAVPVDSSATRLSSVRPELKGELKLAANFSFLKADRSQARQDILLNQDSPPLGQVQLSGKHLSETDAPGLGDPMAVTQQYQPPVPMTGEVLGSAAEPQQNDPTEWDHVKGGARLPGHEVLLPFWSKGNSTSQHPGDSKSSGPIGHHSLAGTSSTFDVTRTSSALDCKPSASRHLLRQSNSFSLPRSKESNKLQDSGSSRVSEEMSLDSLQWSYLRDACHTVLEELCRSGRVQILERHTADRTVVTLQAADRSRLFEAKGKMEALVEKCPDLVCQSLSYSELAVDGPDDSALNELCSLLQGKSLQAALCKDKDKLYLVCPKEMLPGVTETFCIFSSRRLCALKSSSMSPGPESTGQPSVIQPRSQDMVLDAALTSSLEYLQMVLQRLNISDKADTTDMPRTSWVPETKERRSPSPWRFQQPRGQEKANGRVDSGAGRGGSSLLSPAAGGKPSPAGLRESKEQLKTKLPLGQPDITQPKQGLPDKFPFARDKGKNRGGHNEAMGQLCSQVPAAEGAPRPYPRGCTGPQLLSCHQLQPNRHLQLSPGPRARPRGRSSEQEPDLPSQQRRDPSFGQESSMIPPGLV